MDEKKRQRLIELRIRSMKDEPNFNIELAEKQERIACDSALVIIFLKGEDGALASRVASINGETLTQMSFEEQQRVWISFTATLANLPDVDNKFLKHICNLLHLKNSNLLSIPDPSGETPS